MMEHATDPKDKRWAVEFFTREQALSGPSVTVNVASGGYEYRRPDQRLVDISPTPSLIGRLSDTSSEGHDDQALDDER